MELQGYQKKWLRGQAHALKPVVMIGQRGLSASLLDSFEEALAVHELIKIRFIEPKDKETKRALIAELEKTTLAEMVGMTGHIAIFFRQNRDPGKRRIRVPQRPQGNNRGENPETER